MGVQHQGPKQHLGHPTVQRLQGNTLDIQWKNLVGVQQVRAQELDIWKFNIGGFKISSGYRYKSGHAVPSVNVGYEYENKISKNKTAFTFEFRGLKNK